MKERSPKLKAQGSKEIPRVKLEQHNGGALGLAWWQQEESRGLMVLRDGPPGEEERPWDLLKRTAIFGERVVRFSRTIPRDPTNNRLISQLVGAGTSVGANYCEANEAVSKKDFTNIVSRCVKEAKETKFFLRMVVASEPHLADEARPLYREAHELLLIFGAMRRK